MQVDSDQGHHNGSSRRKKEEVRCLIKGPNVKHHSSHTDSVRLRLLLNVWFLTTILMYFSLPIGGTPARDAQLFFNAYASMF